MNNYFVYELHNLHKNELIKFHSINFWWSTNRILKSPHHYYRKHLYKNSPHVFFNFFLIQGVGVYISRIEEGSVAERAGLRPGDTILEVNGTPFTAISHDEALKVINSQTTYIKLYLSIFFLFILLVFFQ